ncbi:UNVERIFIED_CONTAM: hypothetical protein FKN15_003671 [Acipenser sinensis]
MELHLLSSTLLQISGLQGQTLGRSLASLIVAHRQLWLSQARVPDVDKTTLLDAPISPGHTFGPAVEEILQKSHRTAQKDIICSICEAFQAWVKEASLGRAMRTPPAKPCQSVFQMQTMAPRPQQFPAYPDFMEEVHFSCDHPASSPSVLKHAAPLVSLEGADKLGLAGFPLVDSTLVALVKAP